MAAPSTATDLVAYANKLLGLSLDLSAEIKKGDLTPVVSAVSPKVADLLALDAETDVEGALNMLADVVAAALPADQAEAELKKLLAAATASTDEKKTLLRLRVATNVFNKAVAFPALRFDALVAVIEYASATGLVNLVSSYFDAIDELLPAASLTAVQRRKLLLTVANVVEKEDASSPKVLAFLDKYLATFAGVKDAKELATGKDAAVRATQLVLQQPVASFLARIDLLSHPVVKATVDAKLFELLEVVSQSTLHEFAAFQKANAAVFTANKIDAAELAATMRLFTLCSQPTGYDEISYAAVAKSLDISEDEVEQWVVRAITANLVTAKIDQLRRTVVIQRALQRSFGAEQWQDVDAKLQLYKKNVGALLQTIRSARQAQEQQ